MFTGIVERVGKVKKTAKRGRGLEVWVDLGPIAKRSKIGDSIAVCGVCLTVEAISGSIGKFYLSPETLEKTWLKDLNPSMSVNLEPAARFGDSIGGHLVQGHVDGVGKITGLKKQGEGVWLEIQVPKNLQPFLLMKGSITVDGISLTVAKTKKDGFAVAVIPVTLEKTSLRFKKNGDPVNLESDLIGKWVAQLVKR